MIHNDSRSAHPLLSPAPSPSPTLSSPFSPTSPHPRDDSFIKRATFSEYVKGEITAVDFVVTPDVKAERVSNFFAVPREIEKLMLFGYFVCLDSFLNIFTILPIRCIIAGWKLVQSVTKRQRSPTSPIHLIDLQRASLLLIVTVLLFQLNPSRLYHSIRGQALVKLYVIFNVLEICDKLCCSFGMDILDSLVARGMDSSAQGTENSKGDDRDKFKLKPFTHYLLALCYVFIHGVVMFYQVITLNVAINSYNNALLTLLISNQFVEIKSSVFKRFESENLFQLSCSDIVERFNLSAFLLIVIIRNYIELYSSSVSIQPIEIPLPSFLTVPATAGFRAFSSQVDYLLSTKFTSFFEPTSSLSIFIPAWFPFCWSIISPALLVFASEILVDWMKHAFITKFNGIRPVVYKRFRDVLCKDLVKGLVVPGPTSLEPTVKMTSLQSPQDSFVSSRNHGSLTPRPASLTPDHSSSSTPQSSPSKESQYSATPTPGSPVPNQNSPRKLSGTLPSSPIGFPEFKYIDHVPYVAKRIGFASLPLAALMIRFFVQILPLFMSTFFDSYAPDYAAFRSFETRPSSNPAESKNVSSDSSSMRNATVSHATFYKGGYNHTGEDKGYNETWIPYFLAQLGLNSSEPLSEWFSQSELIVRNFTYNNLKFFSEWGLTIVVITTVYICLLIVKLFLGYALLDAACSRYQKTVNQDMIIRSRRPSVVSPSASAPGIVSSSPTETRDSEQRLQTQIFDSLSQIQEKESKYVKGKERENFIRRRRTASGTGVKLSQIRRRSTSAIERYSGITKNEFKAKLEEEIKSERENSAPNQKVVPSWVIKHTKQIDVQLPRLPEQFQSQPQIKSQTQSGESSQKSSSISSRNSAESLIPIGQDEQDKKILASLENIDRFSLVKNRIP